MSAGPPFTYARVRAFVYAGVALAFALLFTLFTVRVALGGEWLEIAITAAITVALWMLALRWIRRIRGHR
jgi:hypothetical protein